MNFEPQKFFVGLIDFFSVLLPGAIFAYAINRLLVPAIDPYLVMPAGTEGWMIFGIASYLLGHFIFLLGAWLDEGYDWLRKKTLGNSIERLARRGELRPRWQRRLLWLAFKNERDVAVNRAGKIKAAYLGPFHATKAINTFQWAKLHLSGEHPEAFAAVQRFEADSKFFRSLVILLVFIVPLVASLGSHSLSTSLGAVIVGIVLMLLAAWRYVEQRHKATNHAYWAVITLEGRRGKIASHRPAVNPDAPTHAGGVVRRSVPGGYEYLLVEATKDPSEKVLPKGHIEDGERLRDTAVREVHEETGVWAKISGDLDIVSFVVDEKDVRARVFLMDFLEEGSASDVNREHVWLSIDEAIDRATHDETKTVLRRVREMPATRSGVKADVSPIPGRPASIHDAERQRSELAN